MRSLSLLLLAATLLLSSAPALADTKQDPIPPLLEVLASAEEYKQRLTAIIGLTRLKNPRAVPPLIKALGDGHHLVRGAAARALGVLGDQRARKALEDLVMGDPEQYVRAQAQGALAALMKAEEGKQSGGTDMELLGSLGTLDQRAIQQGLAGPTRKAAICLGRLLDTAPYLGGQLSLKFRIRQDGTVRWLRLLTSDLGSLQVERCMMTEMRASRFSKPEGGEAEFSVPLSFGGGQDVTLLDPQLSAAAKVLRQNCAALLAPAPPLETAGTPAPDASQTPTALLTPPPGLVLVVYIDSAGAVLSVGMSAPEAMVPEDLADQMAANIQKLLLKDPEQKDPHAKLVQPFSCTEQQQAAWLKQQKKKQKKRRRRGRRRARKGRTK